MPPFKEVLILHLIFSLSNCWQPSSFSSYFSGGNGPRSYYDYGFNDYDIQSFPASRATFPAFPMQRKATSMHPLDILLRKPTTVIPSVLSRFNTAAPSLPNVVSNFQFSQKQITASQFSANRRSGNNRESKPVKVIRLILRVPSTENIGILFKRQMANRISSILLELFQLVGHADLVGDTFLPDSYASDVLIFEAERENQTATEHVVVDFGLVLNSTILDPTVASNLIRLRYSREELSKFIGYYLAEYPEAVTVSSYSLQDAVGIDKLIELEFENFREQSDPFYFVVSDWLNGIVLPVASRFSNESENAGSALIVNMKPKNNRTIVDFTITSKQPTKSDLNISDLVRFLFVSNRQEMQDMIDFTILSAGYLNINESSRNYVPIYYGGDEYFLPDAVDIKIVPPTTPSSNITIPLETLMDATIKARIVFNISENRENNMDTVEKVLRTWTDAHIVPLVKRSLNYSENGSTVVLNSTTNDVKDKTFSLDFAVIFQYRNNPVAVKSSVLTPIIFEDNFENTKETSPYPIISGGFFLPNTSNEAYISILNATHLIDTSLQPMTEAPIRSAIFVKQNTGAVVFDGTTTLENDIENVTTTAAATTTTVAAATTTTAAATTATTAATSAISEVVTTSFPIDLSATNQTARIIFSVPTVQGKPEQGYVEDIRRWLDSFIAPFVQQAFGTNLTAGARIVNSTMGDNNLTVDFVILFMESVPPKVANGTEVAFELFFVSIESIKATTPYTILSGGYLIPGNESVYAPIYSSVGGRDLVLWERPEIEIKHLLQIDMKIPSVVDVDSIAFKRLLRERLKTILLPVLKREPVADSVYVDSTPYTRDPNVFDIQITNAKRMGPKKDERVATQFVIIHNSSLLNGEVASNALGLNVDQNTLQRGMNFKVLTLPTAVTQIKSEPVEEPPSRLWIIAAVLVPLIIIVILINICICTCCRPAPRNQKSELGLPQAPAEQATLPPPQQQPYPFYPTMYYYPPAVAPKVSGDLVDKGTSARTAEQPSSPEHFFPAMSPPANVTYQLLPSAKRSMRGRKTKRRQIRPIGDQDAAVISHVASGLLREALRNLSPESLLRAGADQPTTYVTDQVCQTDDSNNLRGLAQHVASDRPWTREYEQSLLRLATLVVSPNGVQVLPKDAQAAPPIVNLSPGHTTLPQHGSKVADALQNTAGLAISSDPKLPPLLTDEPTSDKAEAKEAEYLDMNDTQVKQLERLNALFLNMPPADAEVPLSKPVKTEELGAKPDNQRNFADEHDVIVDSLRPGVPPRRLLEAIRTELENYGKK